jgi:nitrite reductase/ring-hydroxylating ferredoxin subunit
VLLEPQYLKVGAAETFDSPDMTVLSLLGRRVGVWRDAEGTWHAMEMVCRHQNGDLSKGAREGDIVTCSRHGWHYDLSTGACLTEAWAALRRYGIKVEEGQLWVTTGPIESGQD